MQLPISTKIDLIHGKELASFRKSVDIQKARELDLGHDNAWFKSMTEQPFYRKVNIALTRIMEFVLYYEGNVYVSFSGGKDSTVLLDLVRRVLPDCPAVFCDTGLEYPEIRNFAKSVENVHTIYPTKWNADTREYERTYFPEIIRDEGYPFPSKEVSRTVREAKRGAKSHLAKLNNTGLDSKGNISKFNCPKWKFLLDAPFNVSEKCCNYLKKLPFKCYERETGRYPIIGTMASESMLRRNMWIRSGCNIFSGRHIQSKPLSCWTDSDVLYYIKSRGLDYCKEVYGDIVEKDGKYTTTLSSRTGCMFCLFGIHLDPIPNRLQRMAVTYPKQYDYCVNTLGMGEVLDYCNIPYKPL